MYRNCEENKKEIENFFSHESSECLSAPGPLTLSNEFETFYSIGIIIIAQLYQRVLVEVAEAAFDEVSVVFAFGSSPHLIS